MGSQLFYLILSLVGPAIVGAEDAGSLEGHYKNVVACSPREEHPRAKELLSDLTWLRFSPGRIEKSSGLRPLGHQVVLKGCENVSGGPQRLADDLSQALKRGLSCLANQGPYRFKDASRLLNLLLNPLGSKIQIQCFSEEGFFGVDDGSPASERTFFDPLDRNLSALAAVCTNSEYPAMALSVDKINRSTKIVDGYSGYHYLRLFHESYHLLGYLHGYPEDYDVYDVEDCCFEDVALARYGPGLAPLIQKSQCEKIRSYEGNI